MSRLLGLCAALLLGGVGPLDGQPTPAALDRVERDLESQRYADARRGIDSWWTAAGDSVGGELRARALFLRAVLTDSLAAAERDLLRLAVEHPQSPRADRALMRLAQSRLAHGDSAGAQLYLERLVRDHPQSGERGRALALLRRPADPAAASAAPRAPRAPPAEARAPAPPAAAAEPHRRPRGPEYTVQAGAFAGAADAQRLRDALRAAGFDAFLARAGASPETVVRVGAFRDRAAAEAMAARLRSAGHSPRVVTVGS